MTKTTSDKTVLIFGNPDVELDSVPIRVYPELQTRFPNIHFVLVDPNEEWHVSGDLTIIDTIVGLPEIQVFESLERFTAAPRVSMHDFDALANIRLLKKLGKITNVRIIGIPPDLKKEKAVSGIQEILNNEQFWQK